MATFRPLFLTLLFAPRKNRFWKVFLHEFLTGLLKPLTNFTKVPILKECHFGKMKLWRVEHFWTLFVFTFGRDCYCIQQSRPKMKTKSVQKCSTRQSFTFPKWHSFKIGTLAILPSMLLDFWSRKATQWKREIILGCSISSADLISLTTIKSCYSL